MPFFHGAHENILNKMVICINLPAVHSGWESLAGQKAFSSPINTKLNPSLEPKASTYGLHNKSKTQTNKRHAHTSWYTCHCCTIHDPSWGPASHSTTTLLSFISLSQPPQSPLLSSWRQGQQLLAYQPSPLQHYGTERHHACACQTAPHHAQRHC
jgi:hypothetical protein